jgi:hypothetical protein
LQYILDEVRKVEQALDQEVSNMKGKKREQEEEIERVTQEKGRITTEIEEIE